MACVSSNFANNLRVLENRLGALSIYYRNKSNFLPKPRLRNPTWLTQKLVSKHSDYVTQENKQFLDEVVQDKLNSMEASKPAPQPSNVEWTPKLQRTGVIARKIGVYPLWLKDGTKIATTLLQVLDNHVIKYTTPEEYVTPRKRVERIVNKKGCILMGAECASPANFTREYCGIFKDSGIVPTRNLARFFISPNAALPVGTSVTAMHFQVGNFVDIRGKTIDRGFQGVMKRHGFSGMPASHGVTKTHRRPGNIGGGGEKARVWPGTKLPGHMGNRYRIAKGLKIWRINTKYNVLWVSGQAIPGETNSVVTVFDTNLPLRKPSKPVPFPTYLPELNEPAPEEIFDEEVHCFGEPSIVYNE